MYYARIYNADEIRSLGSGYRFVFIKEGRKYARIFYPATATWATISLSILKKMMPTPVTDYPKTRIIKNLRVYAKSVDIKVRKVIKEIEAGDK